MELPAASNSTAANLDLVDSDPTHDVDVREVPRSQRYPLIFARFAALAGGQSFVLVNSHDPRHLRQEFDRDHPGTYEWQYLESGRAVAAGSRRGAWRIRITRLVDPARRQLDAHVIQLRPGGRIETHAGPDLDVLIHVPHGSGRLSTAASTIELNDGALVWLPCRSHHAITAGADGLRYLSVHSRRPALSVGAARG